MKVLFASFIVEMRLRKWTLSETVSVLGQRRFLSGTLQTQSDHEIALTFCHQIGRRILRRPICQRTSLVMFWLSRQGAIFKIGVRQLDHAIEAHAWMEWDGHDYSDPVPPAEYAELTRVTKAL